MDKTLNDAGGLYPSRVMHRRRVAPLYRFVYRIFYVLVDVDRLEELDAGRRFFSHNRFNLLSVHDRDHGDGQGLRAWAERLLAGAGIELAGGRIRLLVMPRVLGWAFNPISLWYCDHRDGTPRAVIVEVNNTFGEKHSYLLASGGAPMTYEQAYEKDKCFHVSPLFDMVGRYRFKLEAPGAQLRVLIHETREGVPILDTTLLGERRALSDAAILKQVLAMPLQMFKVLAAIHWQALKIWLRGARFHRAPPPPKQELT